MAIVVAVPIALIFAVIAFFKISELWLLAFVAKIIRTKFFDTDKKFQVNFEKTHPVDIMIMKSKQTEKKESIEQKNQQMNEELVKKIESGGLL